MGSCFSLGSVACLFPRVWLWHLPGLAPPIPAWASCLVALIPLWRSTLATCGIICELKTAIDHPSVLCAFETATHAANFTAAIANATDRGEQAAHFYSAIAIRLQGPLRGATSVRVFAGNFLAATTQGEGDWRAELVLRGLGPLDRHVLLTIEAPGDREPEKGLRGARPCTRSLLCWYCLTNCASAAGGGSPRRDQWRRLRRAPAWCRTAAVALGLAGRGAGGARLPAAV